MKTFETVHYKDMISNNDVVKLLEEVGFKEMIEDDGESGYIVKLHYDYKKQDIEVYLNRGYLNIHLTPAYLNLTIYKLDSQTFYYQGKLSRSRSWYSVKQMKYKKEAGMEEFKNFLLLSICRDSFLDPEEEEAYKYRRRSRDMIDGFYIKDEGWKEWYL